MSSNAAMLTERIHSLSPEQINEVDDFVEFLQHRGQERGLMPSATALSAPAFDAVWDNPEDAAYDAL